MMIWSLLWQQHSVKQVSFCRKRCEESSLFTPKINVCHVKIGHASLQVRITLSLTEQYHFIVVYTSNHECVSMVTCVWAKNVNPHFSRCRNKQTLNELLCCWSSFDTSCLSENMMRVLETLLVRVTVHPRHVLFGCKNYVWEDFIKFFKMSWFFWVWSTDQRFWGIIIFAQEKYKHVMKHRYRSLFQPVKNVKMTWLCWEFFLVHSK